MTGPLLNVRDLRISIAAPPGGEAIDPVVSACLRAEPGEVVGVAGESGSGKSLTLRAIAGLLPERAAIAAGRVEVAGVDVAAATPAELRELRGGVVGMIFQEPMTALNPTMRIGSQIAEPARAHLGLSRSGARQRATELLARMGFSDPKRSMALYPHQLSGGMRQRVMIAIALAGEPSLLLCDEPTTALDATVTMRVLDLLVDLSRDLGVGVVLVTHDLGVIARTCERIVVMYGGRVVEEGPAGDVLRRPRHPYTLALLRAVPTRKGTLDELKAIPGSPPAPAELPPGCPFAPRCGLAEPACGKPVETVAIGQGRMTACRRHRMLSDLKGAGVA